MLSLNGRWIVNYFFPETGGKTFSQINSTCHGMSSQVAFVKELHDRWNPNWVVNNKGGPNKEMYIGLDPNTLPRACTASGWDDHCQGLRWFDGTLYDRKVVAWGVETNGQTSVGCFIVTVDSATNGIYIKGVNDCDVKRAAACVKGCMTQRCPMGRELKNSHSDRNDFKFLQGDTIRFEYFLVSLGIYVLVSTLADISVAFPLNRLTALPYAQVHPI